ncbi:MAG: MFS transporter [Candidatus Aminicenantes bacterium]|nr:MFS transporter [Candidatus Aminicenantes bacterium]
MAVWFSASAVVASLAEAWSLSESGRAWLTMSVQLGFVAGTLAVSLLNLPDRWPAQRLFAASALAGALATGALPALVDGFVPALILRLLTGVAMAGVYPVGMKIMATWTKDDRGLGIGLLVGALTVGSASPHLLRALGSAADWRLVLYLAAGLAAVASAVAGFFVREGPLKSPSPRLNWAYAGRIWRERATALVNLGYLGHMWELYAMWTWLPSFLTASYAASGIGARTAALASFAVIGVGGLGSVAAGKIADRVGRPAVTIAALAVSGSCALSVGFLFGGSPTALTAVCLVWGFAVVADSAQFSAGLSELCRPEYTGTALAIQTSLGFLLTMVTIRLVPMLVNAVGWRYAFAALAAGPAVGAWAMARLRRPPEAAQTARGRG